MVFDMPFPTWHVDEAGWQRPQLLVGKRHPDLQQCGLKGRLSLRPTRSWSRTVIALLS
jgi:hypothetical protein